MDPHGAVHCMPAAGIDEVTEDRVFRDSIELKLGFLTAR